MTQASAELKLRVQSALVLALLALGTLWIGGIAFDILWTSAAVWIFAEWSTLASCDLRRWRIATVVLTFVAAALALSQDETTLAGGILALGVAIQALIGGPAQRRLWSVSGMLYAAVILFALLMLRHDERFGMAAVGWMFAVVWSTDIAAYFTGRALGGPKLMPSVSPKKTWSGFVGGAIVGTAAGLAVAVVSARYGQAPLPLGTVAVLSLVASLAGQVGDLAESAMKRRAGVKDSGRLIPGHGGIMDRLDAFWAVALIALAGLILYDLA